MQNDFRTQATWPLGLRNNNPGNIRPDGVSQWQGAVGENKGFIVFSSMAYGIRAWLINYRSQIVLHDIHTLQELIHRYAPAKDNNNEAAYVAAVTMQTGIKGTDKLPTTRKGVTALFQVFAAHEIGPLAGSISMDDINNAFDLLPASGKAFFSN